MSVVTDEMVSRFLCWQIPADFKPDFYISFDSQMAERSCGGQWPTGTNLLTATQARAMLEHVLGAAAATRSDDAPAVRSLSTWTDLGVVTDPTDPRLTRGVDAEPTPQAEVYLVLSDEELAKGFVRPVRDRYRHTACGKVTTMTGVSLPQTYARDPKFYGATYCVHCRKHLPVAEFTWEPDGSVVGS